MKFYTKFDLPKKRIRKLNEKDNVDRVSYLDTPTQIKMFMQAGKNMKFNHSHAMYSDIDTVLNDTTQFSTPVYSEDPVVFFDRVNALKESHDRIAQSFRAYSDSGSATGSENSVVSKDNNANSEDNSEVKEV